MDDELLKEELVDSLEINGEIRLYNEEEEIYIRQLEEDEGEGYISNTKKRFDESREAIEWAIEQFDGLENIEEWD